MRKRAGKWRFGNSFLHSGTGDQGSGRRINRTGGRAGWDWTYPLTDGHTFKCWWALDNDLATRIQMGDHPYFQKVEEITGVHIEFDHPTYGGESESYNILIASSDYGDFIAKIGTYHSRGLDDLVDQDIILDMKDRLSLMPNLDAAIKEGALVRYNAVRG